MPEGENFLGPVIYVLWPLALCTHTSYNSFYKWAKIWSLEIIIFELKNDGKKWSRIDFEIHPAPSEIPAKLPGQFCADIFALGSSYSEHFLPSFLSSKMIISRLQILAHL